MSSQQTNSTSPTRPAALIIGINHYYDFDKSIGMTPGFSNLQGCINDTKVYYELARLRGVPPENICVMTSAPISPEFLGEGAEHSKLIHVATAEMIGKGIDWLLLHLQHGEHPVGFVAFCGHGDYMDDEESLVLCAQDTYAKVDPLTGKMRLENVVRMKDVRTTLSAPEGVNLTYFLDVCHGSGEFNSSLLETNPIVAAMQRHSKYSTYVGRTSPSQTPDPILMTRSRCLTRRPIVSRPAVFRDSPEVLLVASDLGKPSYEFNFNGVWHGAFTRVIRDILDRWNHPSDTGAARFYITNEELLHRADLMLRAMNFDQSPSFVGLKRLRNNRVLARENSHDRYTGEVRAARKHEFSPTSGGLGYRAYALDRWVSSAWSRVGQVIVVGGSPVKLSSGLELQANRSYWFWSAVPFGGTFALRPNPALPPPTATAVPQAVYSNGPFPDAAASYTSVATTHSIRLNLPGAAIIGYCLVGTAASGPPPSLLMYMVSGTGQTPPFFDVVDEDRLVFTPNAGPRSFTGWQQNDVLQPYP